MRRLALGLYRSVAVPALAASGAFRILRWKQRSAALVLMYHGVDALGPGEALVNPNHIRAQDFGWQMELLRKHYTVVPLAEIVRRVRGRKPVGGLAAITFDDGYLGVHDHAAPILRDLGLPSTTFIIAGCVEGGEIAWYDRVEALISHTSSPALSVGGISYPLENRTDAVRAFKRRLKALNLDERDDLIAELAKAAGPLSAERLTPYLLMTWEQMRELQPQGMDFGAHTFSHPHLSKVAAGSPRAAREIDEAAELISQRLAIPLREMIFCYPDGDYTKSVRDRVEALGMAGAVAVYNRLARETDDPFALPRVGVHGGHSRATFQDATVGFTGSLKTALTFRRR